MMMRQSGHLRCSLRPKMAPLNPPPTMTTVLAAMPGAGILVPIKRCLHVFRGTWAREPRWYQGSLVVAATETDQRRLDRFERPAVPARMHPSPRMRQCAELPVFSHAGLAAQRESGWFGALHARHFGEAPLVEDNSARSAAYTVDAQIGYKKSDEWLAAATSRKPAMAPRTRYRRWADRWESRPSARCW